jgi:hypothetical protein
MQSPPKFTHFGIFGFENMPSGNPSTGVSRLLTRQKDSSYFSKNFRVTLCAKVFVSRVNHHQSWKLIRWSGCQSRKKLSSSGFPAPVNRKFFTLADLDNSSNNNNNNNNNNNEDKNNK